VKKYLRLSLTAILLTICVLVAFPTPVLAINEPDTPPSVNAVYVYNDCLEDGDVGVLIDYFLDYAVSPNETATQSYIASFIDIDGITQLESVAPYAFQDSGYGRGLIWIYFSATEAATYNLNSANVTLYRVWLMGNPTLAWTDSLGNPTVPPKTIASIDQWNTTGVTATLLALRILYYADQLELIWSLDLIGETAIGSRLTTLGSSYFTNVIPDLRLIAPACFSDTETDPDYTPISYDTTFGATASNGTATITGSPVTLHPRIPLINSSFESKNPPTGWILEGTGATFARSATQSVNGTYSGLLTRVGANCDIYQSLNATAYRGDIVAFGAWVYATVANRARIALDDDVAAIAYSAYHTGAAGWEFLTVTYTVNAAADWLRPYCYVDTGNTAVYFDVATLIEGSNIVNTGATTGTIILDLAGWTFGTVMDMTGTITGSPVAINPGTNTLTAATAGTFFVDVGVVDTISRLEESVAGTGMDLTTLAEAFGMSRWFMSGLIWVLITIIICAAVYRAEKSEDGFGVSTGGSKVIILVFTVCIIGGTLLGLLHPMIAALLFIGSGAMIGYVFFFKSETLHKGFMFMIWMFVIVSIAGNVMAGSISMVATRLTVDVPAGAVNSLTVASTEGFSDSGIIVVGDEQIGYPSKTATTFERTNVLGVTTNPIVRGMNSTTDAAHLSGVTVRTLEASLLNASVDYKIARIADSAGIIGMVTLPAKLLDLILTFFTLPLGFLGTDLAILTYIWGIVAIGMVFGIGMALAGGRRV
jgi:hypothetical protein